MMSAAEDTILKLPRTFVYFCKHSTVVVAFVKIFRTFGHTHSIFSRPAVTLILALELFVVERGFKIGFIKL